MNFLNECFCLSGQRVTRFLLFQMQCVQASRTYTYLDFFLSLIFSLMRTLSGSFSLYYLYLIFIKIIYILLPFCLTFHWKPLIMHFLIARIFLLHSQLFLSIAFPLALHYSTLPLLLLVSCIRLLISFVLPSI